jgi:hypothetical protein
MTNPPFPLTSPPIKHPHNTQTANIALQTLHQISEITSVIHAKDGKTLPVNRMACAHSEACLVLRARLCSRF